MSRRFDDYMDDKFELYGEQHSLIEPDGPESLMKAIQVKGLIQDGINGLMHDEDSSGYCDLLQRQEEYIEEYLTQIGEFDNTCLVSNIGYLAKKNGLRLGELETLLGISAGYISRTAKENSNKKLSIDVVWKIAKLFGIEMRTLLETNLQIPNSNTEMVTKFLTKLRQQTEENKIHWDNRGGSMCYLDEGLKTLGILSEEDDGSVVYHPSHMNQSMKFVLADDIYSCGEITADKELVMIAYSLENREDSYFCDFIFMWKDTNSERPTYHWEKAFYSNDDKLGTIQNYAETLMHHIQSQEMDAAISPSVRSIISDYLQ